MAKFKSYSTEQGELVPTYLSEWVPESHLVRLVSDIVDQLDLSALTKRYSHRGEEAYHPAMLLKLWFYGYATGVFTSRKIRTALDENIPFRWLCGGQRPDFRTISDFRKHHLEQFPNLFQQVLELAMKLGYVSLGHVSIDGSKVKANASKHKAMSRARMKQELQRWECEIKDALKQTAPEEEQNHAHPVLHPQSVHADLEDRQVRLEKIRTALHQLESRKPEATSETPEKDQINFTDAASRIMDTKTQGVIQGYNPQIAVDADHRFIVGLQMSSNSNDGQQFEGVLADIKANTERLPAKVSADAGYFSKANILAAQTAGIDAYIAAGKEGKRAQNPYDKSNFQYDPETDTYICPAGKRLTRRSTQHARHPKKETTWTYESQACLACPFQKECAKGKSGKRTITRAESDPVREAMRTKVQGDEGKALYRKRKTIVEPAWGEMKEVQGFRQFHLRGEKKVAGEFVLLALSYNIRKLHSAKNPKPATLYKREKSAQNQKNAA